MPNNFPKQQPVVRFRVNGGGTHIFNHETRTWNPASKEDMTAVVAVLLHMTRFNA